MANSGCEDGTGEEEETFLYFAYGSNLLTERIHLRNPSAAFCCVARLQVSVPAGALQRRAQRERHGSPKLLPWGMVGQGRGSSRGRQLG
jgi:gamma-glutamylcyclotransferase